MSDPSETDDGDPMEETVSGAVTMLTFLVGFGLLALGVPWFWIAFPVGFGGVLPMALGAVRLFQRRETDEPTEDDPLTELKARYARGELTEAEFERRVEALLERDGSATAADQIPEPAREREPE